MLPLERPAETNFITSFRKPSTLLSFTPKTATYNQKTRILKRKEQIWQKKASPRTFYINTTTKLDEEKVIPPFYFCFFSYISVLFLLSSLKQLQHQSFSSTESFLRKVLTKILSVAGSTGDDCSYIRRSHV